MVQPDEVAELERHRRKKRLDSILRRAKSVTTEDSVRQKKCSKQAAIGQPEPVRFDLLLVLLAILCHGASLHKRDLVLVLARCRFPVGVIRAHPNGYDVDDGEAGHLRDSDDV